MDLGLGNLDPFLGTPVCRHGPFVPFGLGCLFVRESGKLVNASVTLFGATRGVCSFNELLFDEVAECSMDCGAAQARGFDEFRCAERFGVG